MTKLILALACVFLACPACAGKDACRAQIEQIATLEARIDELESMSEAQDSDLYQRIRELAGSNLSLEEQVVALEALLEAKERADRLAKERAELLMRLLSRFDALIEEGALEVKVKKNRIVLQMPNAVLFQSGKDTLSTKGKTTLTSVAKVLADIDNRMFQVAGHTDNVAKKNMKFSSNWELSTARAITVLDFLIEQGIEPEKLSAAGYGEFQPEADNETDMGKVKNRRIEITLVPNLDELPDLSMLKQMIEEYAVAG